MNKKTNENKRCEKECGSKIVKAPTRSAMSFFMQSLFFKAKDKKP